MKIVPCILAYQSCEETVESSGPLAADNNVRFVGIMQSGYWFPSFSLYTLINNMHKAFYILITVKVELNSYFSVSKLKMANSPEKYKKTKHINNHE